MHTCMRGRSGASMPPLPFLEEQEGARHNVQRARSAQRSQSICDASRRAAWSATSPPLALHGVHGLSLCLHMAGGQEAAAAGACMCACVHAHGLTATLTTPESKNSCSVLACRLPLIMRLAGFRSLRPDTCMRTRVRAGSEAVARRSHMACHGQHAPPPPTPTVLKQTATTPAVCGTCLASSSLYNQALLQVQLEVVI